MLFTYICPHPSADIRRARSHIAIVLVPGKVNVINALYRFEHLVQVAEHVEKIRALLHAHDSELILFAEPDDAHLVVGLPASASVRPIRRDSSAFEVLNGKLFRTIMSNRSDLIEM